MANTKNTVKKASSKKATANAVKKVSSKKEVVVKEESPKREVIVKEEVKTQTDYTKILNSIYIVLVIIAAILAVNFCYTIFTSTSKESDTKTETTETTTDYDVSEFEQLTTSELVSKIEKGGTQVVYIGRSTCGYCVKFAPIMKEAQKDLGFKTIYVDLEQVTEDDANKLMAYDSYVEENFGYTPMVLVFKDGKYVDGWVGYAELDSYKSFLNEAGIK